jgi:hypothetical protein
VIGTHNRSRRNIIECEIDGSLKNKSRIRIKLIAIEIVRMMSADLGTRTRNSWKGSGSGRRNFERQLGQSKEYLKKQKSE